jgi:hypothetical protein
LPHLSPSFRHFEVFREIRRVLRKDGTAWLVIGDCYNSGGGTHGGGKHAYGRKANTNRGCPGLKPKDLVMLPARELAQDQQRASILDVVGPL